MPHPWLFASLEALALVAAFAMGFGTGVWFLYPKAYRDGLTGLPNRRALEKRLRTRRPLAVLFLDLDEFKTKVNDMFGHDAGDEFIKKIAERFKARSDRRRLRPHRLQGDEFVFVIGPKMLRDVRETAESIAHAVEQPVTLANGAEISVHASIGISLGGPLGYLREANIAMHNAKRRTPGTGQPNVVLYEDGMKMPPPDPRDRRSHGRR